MITKKSILTLLVIPTCLLFIPLVASFTVEGFNWRALDFIFLWVILVGVGFMYKVVASKAGNTAHRIATIIALVAGLMIVWGNLAVGFIGSEDNPANLLYFVALLIAAVCAALGRFKPPGMARAMFVAAGTVFLVPVLAYFVRPHDFSPGVGQVFGLNFFFVGMFVVAGFLFRAGDKRARSVGRALT